MRKNKNERVYDSKISGLKIRVYKNKVKIFNSYQIQKVPKMEVILDNLAARHCIWLSQRPVDNLTAQWVFNNRLYKMHLLRKKTKDIILKNKVGILKTITYSIFGSKGAR